MTRADKIKSIAKVAIAEGVSFLDKPIRTTKGKGDIVSADSLMEEICGDWCVVGYFSEMTDADIDIIYNAMQKHAIEILSLA